MMMRFYTATVKLSLMLTQPKKDVVVRMTKTLMIMMTIMMMMMMMMMMMWRVKMKIKTMAANPPSKLENGNNRLM